MALLTRIYFNAVFGALGGLLGWMLFGVFARPSTSPKKTIGSSGSISPFTPVGGAVIGGAIGYFVVSVEAIRDRSLLRFVRLASYGVLLGMLGGALGMVLGERVNFGLVKLFGRRYAPLGVPRGACSPAASAGCSSGRPSASARAIAARSLGKFSYGTLGGAIGGFVGGAFFGGLYLSRRATSAASAAAAGAPSASSSSAPASARCRPWCRAFSSPPRSR